MPDIEIKKDDFFWTQCDIGSSSKNYYEGHIEADSEADFTTKVNQILADHKLRQLVEEEIKKIQDDISNWEPTSPSMIRSKQASESQIRLLQSLIDKSKGGSND